MRAVFDAPTPAAIHAPAFTINHVLASGKVLLSRATSALGGGLLLAQLGALAASAGLLIPCVGEANAMSDWYRSAY
jgi:hypothetical protein